MFVGEYYNRIDEKGRLTVPVKFRFELGEEFVLTRGFDGCLTLYPQEPWDKFADKLLHLPTTNKEGRKLTRFFVAGASMCTLDKQGRILVPENLRNSAGLTKDIVLAGALDHIEIWSKEKWDADNDFSDPGTLDEIAASLESKDISL
ncbi:MAG: division/cell wall cluster transcriptional repressor MraZ [Eubacterium sp.]|nr:division/cell wall cluster transcriptional repressor MraZ [Eubacterium sp.]